ncbi:hypothetical protein [Streptomyces broussonetiae]|uniref:Uncharacterized protein n=1 Tax=Streptomyces broussonetiae TaxID=2686304 RepID=A0ABV5EK23_9ACTN
MSHPSAIRQPVEPTIVTGGERRLAFEHWLLASAKDMSQAREEWRTYGVALLRLGVRLAAIRISAHLVHAGAGTDDPDAVSAYLERVLLGGPVFVDREVQRYFALVPPSTGRRREWQLARDDAEFIGPGHYLGVPSVDATSPQDGRSFWSVEFESAGALASPGAVKALVDHCRLRAAQQASAQGGS